MFILVCNVHGVDIKRNQHFLKTLCVQHKPVLVALIEPKVSVLHADFILSALLFEDWIHIEVKGMSGEFGFFGTRQCFWLMLCTLTHSFYICQ